MLSTIREGKRLEGSQRGAKAKENRVLWLINHTTLREFEVSLLVSMGFEVFVPKLIPDRIKAWSGSVSYQFDATLSIPAADLAILNQHPFYEQPLTLEVSRIINSYFGTAICIFDRIPLASMLNSFSGRVLLRAFGLEKPVTYGDHLKAWFGEKYVARINKIKHRFWFAEGYDNLADIEEAALKENRIFLPIGTQFQQENTWVGGEKKILFFCPRINLSDYYGKVYKNFKFNFNDISHCIAGAQPTPVLDDPCVAGFQPREQIDKWLQTHEVMFYHSEEPRHLHYHPLEAMTIGMPVVYMREGILGRLGGEGQPGACDSIDEARAKIKRLLNGDKSLSDDIRIKQRKILHHFSYDYVADMWKENFIGNVCMPLTKDEKAKSIAVFWPVACKGAAFTRAKRIAKTLKMGSEQGGEPVRVVFSYLAEYYDLDVDFADLKAAGIAIRETKWDSLTREQVGYIQSYSSNLVELQANQYSIPRDGFANFDDCDFWFLLSDKLSYPLAPMKPYAVMANDYIQRYIPDGMKAEDQAMLENAFVLARQANFVFAPTQNIIEDVVQFAEVPASKVHLLPVPIEFNYPKAAYQQRNKKDSLPYFLCQLSSIKRHDNNILKALNFYYTELKGALPVYMINTFNEEVSVNDRLSCLDDYAKVKEKIVMKESLSQDDFINLLAGAQFLWHPAMLDQGEFFAVEAAYHGVPSLSGDYPQMHYMDKHFNLNLQFSSLANPAETASKLKQMESACNDLAHQLPSRDFLTQFTCQESALKFWHSVSALIGVEARNTL